MKLKQKSRFTKHAVIFLISEICTYYILFLDMHEQKYTCQFCKILQNGIGVAGFDQIKIN